MNPKAFWRPSISSADKSILDTPYSVVAITLAIILDFSNTYSNLFRHTLGWTAPWLMITIILTLELKSSIERNLMTVSTAAIIIYYVSEFSINLYFWFEAAGLPLLLSIFLLGRQHQKLEAGKYILFYVAIPRLPLLVIILRGCWRITTLFNCLAIWVILPFFEKDTVLFVTCMASQG